MKTRSMMVSALSMASALGCAVADDGVHPRGQDAGVVLMRDDAGELWTADAGAPLERDDAAVIIPQAPGSRCSCDAECEGDSTHAGVCVYGICMTRATDACTGGSRDECGPGSRCWRVRDTTEHVCWPDCASFTCEGTCDEDGSCVGRNGLDCDPMCGSLCGEPPCSTYNPMGPCAGAGEVCLAGECVATCSPAVPDGYCAPGSTCDGGECVGGSDCPTWVCAGPSCTDIVSMPGSSDPDSAEARAAGYFIDTRRQYAYLRRDLVMLLQHAACEVAQRFPGTEPIGIMDLSQADGRTPGTDVGSPRHPTTTHRGNDMDLAYYQTDGVNDGQIVCGDGSDRNGNGSRGTHNDGYFCTTEVNIVDWPRQAYWFAMLASTPLVRVFGIDQTMPDDFRTHLGDLHERGWISDDQYDRALDLGYGSSGGWQFHHHHTHMSYRAP